MTRRRKNRKVFCVVNNITRQTISARAMGNRQQPSTHTDWKKELEDEHNNPFKSQFLFLIITYSLVIKPCHIQGLEAGRKNTGVQKFSTNTFGLLQAILNVKHLLNHICQKLKSLKCIIYFQTSSNLSTLIIVSTSPRYDL